MTTTPITRRWGARVAQDGRAQADARFDWLAALVGAWVVGGLYLDGWAHAHGKVDESFFTPWHAVLYAGFAAAGLLYGLTLVRNWQKGFALERALPVGYGLSFIGVICFLVGGPADLLWHTLFGIEESVDALLSPSHLVLATGASLIVSGPLRSLWRRTATLRWGTVLPLLLSVTGLLSMLTFFTQYAHPQDTPWASAELQFVTVRSELFRMRVDGTAQTRLTLDPDQGFVHPAWSPDGTRVAYAQGKGEALELGIMNADGSNPQLLSVQGWNPVWSPDGKQLVYTTRDAGSNDLWLVDADGSNARALVATTADEWGGVWAPDGQTVAFSSDQAGNEDIWLVNADGRNPRQLTTESSADGRPAWSPDGTQLAFASDRSGNYDIWQMSADGSNAQQLTSNDADDWGPIWSPSGNALAFATTRDRNTEIYTMQPDGSAVRNLSRSPGTDDGGRLMAWSPDGNDVVYSSQGHAEVEAELGQIIGITGVLIQTALVMGIALLLLRRWRLPVGSLTMIFTLNALAMSVLSDSYLLAPALILAGVVGDALAWWLRPSAERAGAFHLWALLVPMALYSIYFALLAALTGLGWSIHLWAGTIVTAGIVGLLLSYLVLPPTEASHQAPSAHYGN